MRYTPRHGGSPNRRTRRRFVVRHDGCHSPPPEPTRSPLWSATIDRGRSRIGPDAALPDRARPTRSSIRYPTAHRSGSTRPPRDSSLSTVSHRMRCRSPPSAERCAPSSTRPGCGRRDVVAHPDGQHATASPNASSREYAPLRCRDRGVRPCGPCAAIRDDKSHPAIRNDSRGRGTHGGGSATTDRRSRRWRGLSHPSGTCPHLFVPASTQRLYGTRAAFRSRAFGGRPDRPVRSPIRRRPVRSRGSRTSRSARGVRPGRR
jgi:hypothetical protein